MGDLSLKVQQHQQVSQLSMVTHLVQVAVIINRTYALYARQDHEGSPDVVAYMLYLLNLDVYALLYSGATLSFVSLYITVQFNFREETLS